MNLYTCVEIPEGKRKERTHKYTLEEVEIITATVNGGGRCAVVGRWAGLSLRGLKWEGIDLANETLTA